MFLLLLMIIATNIVVTILMIMILKILLMVIKIGSLWVPIVGLLQRRCSIAELAKSYRL